MMKKGKIAPITAALRQRLVRIREIHSTRIIGLRSSPDNRRFDSLTFKAGILSAIGMFRQLSHWLRHLDILRTVICWRLVFRCDWLSTNDVFELVGKAPVTTFVHFK